MLQSCIVCDGMSEMLDDASVLEVFRCRKKDQLYARQLQNLIIKLASAVAGAKAVARKRALIDRWTQFFYRLLLSVPQGRTLGEEEMGILQVDMSGNCVSFFRQLLHSIILSFGDNLLADCLIDVKKAQIPGRDLIVAVLHFLLEAMQSAGSGAFELEALCYMQVLHRIIGLKYVRYGSDKARKRPANGLSRAFYCIIFTSFLCKITGRIIARDINTRQQNEISQNTDSSSLTKGDLPCVQCSLCRDVHKKATLAPCGHVFCWICCHRWFSRYKNCPECRAEALPSSLRLLRNF